MFLPMRILLVFLFAVAITQIIPALGSIGSIGVATPTLLLAGIAVVLLVLQAMLLWPRLRHSLDRFYNNLDPRSMGHHMKWARAEGEYSRAVLNYVVAIAVIVGIYLIWPAVEAAIADSATGGARAGNETDGKKDRFHWVQLVPALERENKAEGEFGVDALIRAVRPAKSACPTLIVEEADTEHDRQTIPMDMTKRTNPWPDDFPIVVCDARVRTTTEQTVTLMDGGDNAATATLSIPKIPFDGMNEIAFFGDTGCRSNHEAKNFQFCDAEGWPFPDLIKLAAQDPEELDLVVHVGDYFYRQADNWSNWRSDFFLPARPLLQAKPWVMVRGNHEACYTEGKRGYFLLLHPEDGKKPIECHLGPAATHTKPYALDIEKDLRLIVLDTSNAQPDSVVPGTSLRFKGEFELIKEELSPKVEGKKAWLLSHVPLWGVLRQGETVQIGGEGLQVLRKAASGDRLPESVVAVFSGDLHMFEWLEPSDPKRPIQFVVGNSGVRLDPSLLTPAVEKVIYSYEVKDPEVEEPETNGFEVKAFDENWTQFSMQLGDQEWRGRSLHKHGFMTALRSGAHPSWEFQVWTKEIGGAVVCREVAGRLNCGDAAVGTGPQTAPSDDPAAPPK